jgi:ribosomal protein S18 acetylase RimI-like enzyme
MNALAHPSPWESDVLGVRVGSLSSADAPDSDIIREENQGTFDVVFVSCPKWVDPQEDCVAVDHLYDMEISVPDKLDSLCDDIPLVAPGSRHIQIAKTSTVESRFSRDPLLSGRRHERFVRWLTDHQVYVPADLPDSAFLVPTEDDDGARRISLIMVDEGSRGIGVGTQLVRRAFSALPGAGTWRVKVSARNLHAIRFYETIGFRVKRVGTVFHVWVPK